jgi:predicted dehydrogenase
MKTALIGCGNIGSRRAQHAASHARSTLRLVVDTDEPRAEALARQHRCNHATDWRAVLEAGVEAVIVSVPTKSVHEIVPRLLDAGLHVLCEKPLGRNLAEAREITSLARARGVVLETGFNLRFDPGLQKARALVSEGAIGELYFLTCEYVNGAALTNTNGVGSLLDIGLHSLDLALWFLGDVDSVYGEMSAHETPHDDNGFALLRKDRVLAQIHFSFVRWRNRFRFEASGRHGYVLVESLPKWGPQTVTVGARVFPSGVPREERYEFTDDVSWRGEWDSFVRCATGQETQVDLERGLRSMALAALIRDSAQRGVSMPVAGPGALIDPSTRPAALLRP